MHKLITVLILCLYGSACHAQAAGSGGNPILEALPFLLLIPLIGFLVVKPTRRNMIEKNMSLIAAIPTAVFIVLGIALLGAGIYSMIIVEDAIAQSLVRRVDREQIIIVKYSGYGIGVLGAILFLAGLMKGIQK